MTHKLAAALLAALFLCAGAAAAHAQDQNTTNPAPAGDMNKPDMNQSDMNKSDKSMGKKGHKMGKMDACKDDIAQYCADAKGRKAIHKCLDDNKDKLSPACKEHHEKMEKRWSKKKGKKGSSGTAPAGGMNEGGMNQGGAPQGGTPPANPPSNP